MARHASRWGRQRCLLSPSFHLCFLPFAGVPVRHDYCKLWEQNEPSRSGTAHRPIASVGEGRDVAQIPGIILQVQPDGLMPGWSPLWDEQAGEGLLHSDEAARSNGTDAREGRGGRDPRRPARTLGTSFLSQHMDQGRISGDVPRSYSPMLSHSLGIPFQKRRRQSEGIHGRGPDEEVLPYSSVNILEGAETLREKLSQSSGDILEAVARYKGGKDDQEAREEAMEVLRLYRSQLEKRGLARSGGGRSFLGHGECRWVVLHHS